MKELLSDLYQLQTIDVKIGKIEGALASLGNVDDFEKKLATAKAMIARDGKALLALESELRDNELKLKSLDEKRKQYDKRLYDGSVTNPKELSAIEKEIKILKEQQSELDSKVLELYEKIEQLRVKVNQTKDIEAKLDKHISSVKSKAAHERERYEEELAKLVKQRESAQNKISDKQLLSRYDRIRKSTGSTGVARVSQSRCGGCNVGLSRIVVRALYNATEMQTCESCGRILMLDSE